MMTTIEKSFFNGRQSVEYKELLEFNGHKLRIRIDRDSYDNQSSAVISIFNPEQLKWNTLDYIHYSQMAVVRASVHAYRKVDANGRGLTVVEAEAFAEDILTLKDNAKALLN